VRIEETYGPSSKNEGRPEVKDSKVSVVERRISEVRGTVEGGGPERF